MKSRRDDNDKPSAKAKSKAKKENKIQKLTQSMDEAQKGMLEMATELRGLRGLPKAIQKQFEEQAAGEKRREGERETRTIADHVSVEGVARIQQEGHLTTTDSSQGRALHSGL